MKKLFLYIDSMQMGGANRVMANLATYFSDEGWEVTLINDDEPQPDVPEYPVPDRVKRLYLQAGGSHVLVKNVRRIRALRRYLRAYRPDVMVSFMGPPNVRAIVAGLGLPVRRIVSVRNDPYREYGTGWRRTLARCLFRLADGVVFQTQDAAAYFPRSVQKKAKVIYNPVHPKFYGCSWTPGGKEIVVIGRLEPQKNPLLAIRAFAMIQGDIPDHTLHFYGDGRLRPELEAHVKAEGLETRVFFHGRTNETERVLSRATMYVLCSDYEGMPNALMEAMAVGTPVISSDCPCGGPRALIENERQGRLVPCGDSEALAQAMLDIATDPATAQMMSAAAAARAKQFQPDVVLQEWASFLE